MDLTTRARIRAAWAVSGEVLASTATINDFFDQLITDWSTRAEKILNRQVATATYTEYLDVEPGQRVFSLRAYPVSSIVSVTSDANREFTGATIAATEFSCQTGTGMLRIDSYSLDTGPGALKVILVGGMAPSSAASFAAVYPDIASAIDMQVQYHFERKASLGKTAVSVGGDNVSYLGPLDWLPQARAVLMSHRRISLGG